MFVMVTNLNLWNATTCASPESTTLNGGAIGFRAGMKNDPRKSARISLMIFSRKKSKKNGDELRERCSVGKERNQQVVMERSRYNALMQSDDLPLTLVEIMDGWHFCNEWDGLLVGPGMGELEVCHCWDREHPVYKTIPKPVDSKLYEFDPIEFIDDGQKIP